MHLSNYERHTLLDLVWIVAALVGFLVALASIASAMGVEPDRVTQSTAAANGSNTESARDVHSYRAPTPNDRSQ